MTPLFQSSSHLTLPKGTLRPSGYLIVEDDHLLFVMITQGK